LDGRGWNKALWRMLVWVVAAIVTGRPEDFALEGSHENFACWRVLWLKLFIFNQNSCVSGLAWDLLLGNA
jgi:hypothetical protein